MLTETDRNLIETVKISQASFLRLFPDAKSVIGFTNTESLLSIIERQGKALEDHNKYLEAFRLVEKFKNWKIDMGLL